MPPQLPIELVERVFELVDQADKPTLAAVCRSCRTGKRAATPLIYHTVSLMRWKSEPVSEQSRRLRLLCRTLIENRPIAEQVTEFDYYVNKELLTVKRQKRKKRKPKYDGTYMPFSEAGAVQQLQLADIPWREARASFSKIEQQRIAQSDEPFLLLLLAICPNLTTWRLEGDLAVLRNLRILKSVLENINHREDFGDATDGGVALNQEPRSGICGLCSIRDIHLGEVASADEEDSFAAFLTVEDVSLMLLMPGLRQLTAESLAGSISEGPESEQDPYYSSVEVLFKSFLSVRISTCTEDSQELTLEGFTGKVEDLEWLLPSCVHLTSLTVQFASREDNFWRFDWADLGDVIAMFLLKLKHLSIDHAHDDVMDDEDYQETVGVAPDDYMASSRLRGPNSGLKGLRHLETLTVSTIALFGQHRGHFDFEDMDESDEEDDLGSESSKPPLASLLPESLKELTILCEDTHFSREQRALLDDPRVALLDNFTIMNCQKSKWISTREGEGRIVLPSAPPSPAREAVTDRYADKFVDAIKEIGNGVANYPEHVRNNVLDGIIANMAVQAPDSELDGKMFEILSGTLGKMKEALSRRDAQLGR